VLDHLLDQILNQEDVLGVGVDPLQNISISGDNNVPIYDIKDNSDLVYQILDPAVVGKF